MNSKRETMETYCTIRRSQTPVQVADRTCHWKTNTICHWIHQTGQHNHRWTASTIIDTMMPVNTMELLVVGNLSLQHVSHPRAGQDKRSQTIAIEVIDGLIEDQDVGYVGVLPHGCCQHNLDFEASAHLSELSVAGRLWSLPSVVRMI